MKTRINFRWIFVMVGFTAQVILYANLWRRTTGSRAERAGLDFIAFDAAGGVPLVLEQMHELRQDLWLCPHVFHMQDSRRTLLAALEG